MTLSAHHSSLNALRKQLSAIRKRVANRQCQLTEADLSILKKHGLLITMTEGGPIDRALTMQAIARKRLALKDEVKGTHIPTAPRRTEPNLKLVRTRSKQSPAASSPNALAAVG